MPLCDSIILCVSYILLITAYGVISEGAKKHCIREKQRRGKQHIRLVRTRIKDGSHGGKLSKEAV